LGSAKWGDYRACEAITDTATVLIGPGLASTVTNSLKKANLQLVGVCDHSAEILSKVGQVRPDVLLLPHAEISSLAPVLRELRARARATKTLIATARCDYRFIATILRHGASGCVRPDSSPAYFAKAIFAVKGGDIWLERRILAKALGDLIEEIDLRALPQSGPGYSPRPLVLTDREKEIVGLLAKGFSNKEIADELGVSKETVKMHLKHVFEKLGVHRRAQVMLHQVCQRLIIL
jgi:DNA-binding NarL/FixJ family response regulator